MGSLIRKQAKLTYSSRDAKKINRQMKQQTKKRKTQ